MFVHIAEVLDGGNLIELIEAMVFSRLMEGRDGGWIRGGAFDVLQEVPLVQLVVRLRLPFAIVVGVSVINEFWKFRTVHTFIIRHGKDGLSWKFQLSQVCQMSRQGRAHNLSTLQSGMIRGAMSYMRTMGNVHGCLPGVI